MERGKLFKGRVEREKHCLLGDWKEENTVLGRVESPNQRPLLPLSPSQRACENVREVCFSIKHEEFLQYPDRHPRCRALRSSRRTPCQKNPPTSPSSSRTTSLNTSPPASRSVHADNPSLLPPRSPPHPPSPPPSPPPACPQKPALLHCTHSPTTRMYR